MTALRKFMFELDFEEHPVPGRGKPEAKETDGDEAQDAEMEAEEEVVPTFSEEDLAAARKDGFESGKQEGVREAASAIERQIADSLNTVVERFGEVVTMQSQGMEQTQAAALNLIHTLTAKAFPKLAEEAGLGEIESMAAGLLDRLRGEPRLVVVVGEPVSGPVKERLDAVAAAQGFDGGIEVIGDPALSAGDCRIEWSTGGAERNLAELMAEIDDIVAGNQDTLPAMDSDAEPEVAEAAEAVAETPLNGDAEAPPTDETQAPLAGKQAPGETPETKELNGEPADPTPEVIEEPPAGGPQDPADGDDGPARTE